MINNEEDNSVLIRIKPTEYESESVYYVPVFQQNFGEDGNLLFSPTFTYDMSLATTDQQMAESFKPDYILELRGIFKATTKSFTINSEP
jgi:hypothetical protein